jgi:acyl carrier protein
LGRLDEQIKIRGFRVEPGEIEALLCHHAKVTQAVVVARGVDSARQLVAYVVGAELQPRDAIELKVYLRQRLPAYMLPSAVVVLGALPLTANHKIDRGALPDPTDRGARLTGLFVEPRSPRQRRIASLWAELLAVDRVGLHDNFFELGGHSLLATELVARVEQELGMRVRLRRLFEDATLEGFCGALDRADEDSGGAIESCG